ncbi:MAG TPA: S8 family serine peptidase [Trueperaceae bacterium]|nr:S8 family serine peptidase [Trueperaceae bacterium]
MRVRRVLRVVVVGLSLVGLLTACSLLFPSALSVTPTSIHMTANAASFTVSNSGDTNSSLNFTVSSSSPYVSLSPSSGTVTPNQPMVVTASVDSSALSPGTNLSATVTVGSNGGSANVRLDYGIGTCGAYTPQALYPAGSAALGAAALGSGPAPRPSRAPAPAPADVVPGQIIVGYVAPAGVVTAALRSQALQRQSRDVRAAYGLGLLAGGNGEGPDLVSAADVPAALAKLHADPRVGYAQRNLRIHRLFTPNDTYYPYNPANTLAPQGEWNMRNFGLPTAWDTTTGASANPIVIAVIDDGVDGAHQDFQTSSGNKVLAGWDFAGNDPDTTPGNGQIHGTHVAGIAAAAGNNGTGIAGVAFERTVYVLPVKVFDDAGNGGTVYELANAIRWAAGLAVSGPQTRPTPADVINMSLGVPGDQPALDAAAQDAWNAGTLLVAAAGNHGSGTPYPTDPGIMSPGNAPCVMAVGSVDGPGNGAFSISSFSDAGPQLEVAAPGGFFDPSVPNGGIVSTTPGNNYGIEVGTSMASPFVAGVAALIKAHEPGLSPAQIRTRIDQTTSRPTNSDRSQYGYGVACADRALLPNGPTTCGQ